MSSQRKKYLFESVLPDIANTGQFGKGMTFLRCNTKDGKTGEQLASSVVFIDAVVTNSDSKSDEDNAIFKLVLKFLPENVKMREILNSKIQFCNEIAMYTEILPSLNYKDIVENLFPTFYWGNTCEVDGKEPIVVIEDLKTKNFGLSKHKIDLDYNHIVLAMEALGKFHALSYITKQQKPLEFNKAKEKLLEYVWNQESSTPSTAYIIGPAALRGVKALCNIKTNETLEKLVEKLEKDSVGLMRTFITPDEPTAVICHGDFCNHNMLFFYDPDGVPTSVRFIDLQTSRYASPVIDLSMILLLNTEPELRSLHWDEFIRVYHNSVTDTVTDAGCIPPSFDQLLNELRNKSFYGYFHCAYFLPLLVSDIRPSVDDTMDLEPRVILQTLLQIGGENATQRLVSILKHFQERDFFTFLN